MKIQIPYFRKREALLYMLRHYNENCNNYLQLDFKQSDIEELYEIDMQYVKKYEAELRLLDQTFLN